MKNTEVAKSQESKTVTVKQAKPLKPLLESWGQNKDYSAKEFTGLAYDSRKLERGDIFFCIEGEHFDGNNFIEDALKRGACLIVSQRPEAKVECSEYVVVEDIRVAMAEAATYFYDYPSQKVRIIGVTGTNGKTSTTHIVERILLKAGNKTGLIGTMGARWSSTRESSEKLLDLHHTTPQCVDFYQVLARMVEQDVSHVVMEVSSHALEQKRVGLCHFSTACLTNITQDHLDYHKTMDRYKEAKSILFDALSVSCHTPSTAVLNADDPSFLEFKEKIEAKNLKLLSYGYGEEADFQLIEESYKSLFKGTDIKVKTPDGVFEFNLKLLGRFNIYNVLASIAIARAENIGIEAIQEGLSEFRGVAGRFEVVTVDEDSAYPLCIVDYAHTPDGLENVLKAAREIVPAGGKLITVFGCGGDRDTSKRPKMGAIAQNLADKIVVTSDNPRSEDPKQIIADILAGLARMQNVQVEEDREKAIDLAVGEARPEDVIVIAGKGHETYQLVKDKVLDFDDRQKTQASLHKRLSS